MLPSTAATLIAFLLLIVPGILFELIRETRQPGATRSPFREVSWVLLVGSLTSAISLLIVGVIRWIHPSWTPDAQLWLEHPARYEATNFGLLARTFALSFLLANGLAVGFAFIIRWRDNIASVPVNMTATPALFNALYSRVEGGKTPMATVLKTDGTRILGVVAEMDPRANRDEGWLVLEEPLRHFDRGNLEIQSSSDWQRVALPYEQISEIWIRVTKEPRETT